MGGHESSNLGQFTTQNEKCFVYKMWETMNFLKRIDVSGCFPINSAYYQCNYQCNFMVSDSYLIYHVVNSHTYQGETAFYL